MEEPDSPTRFPEEEEQHGQSLRMSTLEERDDVDSYGAALHLENDLRTKEVQLGQMVGDNTHLRRLMEEKEAKLQMIHEDLEQARKVRDETMEESKAHTGELAAIHEQSKVLDAAFDQERTSLEELRKALEDPKALKGKNAAPVGDYFHHLTRLENEIKAQGREIEQLHDENATLVRSVRIQEQTAQSLDRELSKQVESDTDAAVEENKRKILELRIEELEGENRVLLQVQRMKTETIEKLSAEMELRGNAQEYVAQLNNEVANREEIIAQLVEEKRKLQKMVDTVRRKEEEESTTARPISFEQWHAERKAVLSEIARIHEARGRLRRASKVSEKRMEGLQAKIRDLVTMIQSEGFAEHLEGKEPEETKEEGMEVDQHVPVEIYGVLQRERDLLRLLLSEKDILLLEKRDVGEAQERRIKKMRQERATERAALNRAEEEMKKEVMRLKEDMFQSEQDHKERIRALKDEQYRAKAQLEKAKQAQKQPIIVRVAAAI